MTDQGCKQAAEMQGVQVLGMHEAIPPLPYVFMQ
jgi:hypothetical protein